MSTFLEYRRDVLNYFDRCIEFAGQNDFESLIPALKQNRKTVEDNKIVVLTCGEMRRGKSTLLSALLEDEGIFPVDIEVTTCLATMVYWGDKERITIVLGSDKGEIKKEITREEICDYVTEKRNPRNKQRAKLLLVELPNPKLKNGLTFVDTPGVGSLNPEHTQVAMSFLPRADVVLFVSDAVAPLTETELIFLQQVKKNCENFLFILTKKDLKADYHTIIEENKLKINQYAGIAKEKICYIPVASTMRLEYMHDNDEYLLRSSNFELLEKTMWDTIDRNRAAIVIAPPLVELATLLKSVEKDIQLKLTALSGDSEKLRELNSRLRALQENRQELLQKGASWQTDIQYEMSNVSGELSRRISEYQNAAIDALESGVQDKKFIKNPNLLRNHIILITTVAASDIGDTVTAKMLQVKDNFERKTGLHLYDGTAQIIIDVDDDPTIVFKKQGALDKLATAGRKVTMNVMGLGAAGGVIGGVVGGVAGFFVGGPVGVVAGAELGAAWGASIGSATGIVKGSSEMVLRPGTEHMPEVRSKLTAYINRTVKDWTSNTTVSTEGNAPQYLRDVSHSLVKNLREGIEESKRDIEKDIADIQKTTNQTQEHQRMEQEKVSKTKSAFLSLAKGFMELKAVKVQLITPIKNEPSRASGDFSHLED